MVNKIDEATGSQVSGEPPGAGPDEIVGARLIDVRRPAVFEQALTTIPGACWRDPSTVDTWCAEWPPGCELVVYCVHGHQVSQGTATRLRALGLNARYLRGGIEGWQAAGRPLADKPAGPAP